VRIVGLRECDGTGKVSRRLRGFEIAIFFGVPGLVRVTEGKFGGEIRSGVRGYVPPQTLSPSPPAT
jgi:hypothetical protein